MKEFELLELEKVFYVGKVAGDQVVHAYHVITVVDEAVAQVRAEEAGSSSYQYPFFLHRMLF